MQIKIQIRLQIQIQDHYQTKYCCSPVHEIHLSQHIDQVQRLTAHKFHHVHEVAESMDPINVSKVINDSMMHSMNIIKPSMNV